MRTVLVIAFLGVVSPACAGRYSFVFQGETRQIYGPDIGVPDGSTLFAALRLNVDAESVRDRTFGVPGFPYDYTRIAGGDQAPFVEAVTPAAPFDSLLRLDFSFVEDVAGVVISDDYHVTMELQDVAHNGVTYDRGVFQFWAREPNGSALDDYDGLPIDDAVFDRLTDRRAALTLIVPGELNFENWPTFAFDAIFARQSFFVPEPSSAALLLLALPLRCRRRKP